MIDKKQHTSFIFLIYSVSAVMFFLLLFPLNRNNIIPVALVGVLVSLLSEKRKPSKNKTVIAFAVIFTVIISLALYRNYLGIYLPARISIIKKISSLTGFAYETIIRFIGIISTLLAAAFEYFFSVTLLGMIQILYKHTDKGLLGTAVKNDVGELPKDIGKAIVIVAASIGIGLLLLIGAFSIPIGSIEDHVASTARYLEPEGMYPKLFTWCTSRLDNSTDAIMFLEAADRSQGTLIEKSMLVSRGATEPNGSYHTLIDHYVHDIPLRHEITYSRYWHGYLIFLKPLLAVADFSMIRGLNLIVQTIIVLILVYLLYDRGKKKYILPYIVSLLLIMPYIVSRSMQFSSCYYLMHIFSVLILLSKDENKEYPFIFLLGGIATAYIDFLTYPMAVFGLPAVFATIVNDEETIERKAINVFRFFMFWVIGYALMWSGKWILASMLTKENVIADAIHSILFRASDSTEIGVKNFSGLDVLAENLGKFFYTPFTYVYVICFIYYVLRARKTVYEKRVKSFFPYILLMLAPILWLMIIKNHSLVHAYFTNKSLIVSAFAILSMLVSASEIE